MHALYNKLVVIFSILTALLLIAIGVTLGQLYPHAFEGITQQQTNQFRLYLFTILLVAFGIAVLISMRVLRHYAKPIDDVTVIATKLAQGKVVDWSKHPYLYLHDDPLSVSIKEIAEHMEETAVKRGNEKDRLKTLVDSIGSGLIMFGRGGTVRLANGKFQAIFDYKEDEIIGHSINDIGLPSGVQELIEDVYMTEQAVESQVAIGDLDVQTYSVLGAPVIGNHGNWLGIVVVVHDITELVRLEGVRKDFVANVSHELRTPVTSIKGFTETLLAGALEDPEVSRKFVEIIYKESDRLHSLVDDLLILSGVERTEFTLEYTDVNLNSMIQEALQLVSGMIEEKNMTIVFEPFNTYTIQGDPKRLTQVIVNLLTNAITYSHEDKEIHIRLERKHDDVLLIIEDEGIGIESSELPRLFERFYRVDRARSRDSGGTGLGLAIVKHLVEAHHGHVEVYSKMGVGTAFYVTLPVEQK